MAVSNPYASSDTPQDNDIGARRVSIGRAIVAWLTFMVVGLIGSVIFSSAMVFAGVYICHYLVIARHDAEPVIFPMFCVSLVVATFPGYLLSLRLFCVAKPSATRS